MQPSEFVNRLIEVLNTENESRIGSDEHLLDVPFMIGAIQQHIGEPQYATFLGDVCEERFPIQFIDREKDDYYTRGKVLIPTRDDCDGVYYLTFSEDERMWGYCMCEPTDSEYNHKHRCCGHGCDWSAPAFFIIKESRIDAGKWVGDESDYWAYSEKMQAHIDGMSADVADDKRRRKEESLREQIAKLQGELEELQAS